MEEQYFEVKEFELMELEEEMADEPNDKEVENEKVDEKKAADIKPVEILIKEQNSVLMESIDSLKTLFEKRLMFDEQNKVISDRMHEELSQYRNDLYSKLIVPILIDIIDVLDGMRKTKRAYMARENGETVCQTMEDYIFELHGLLEKYNVTVYKSTPGEVYIPIKQRVVGKIKTADESLKGIVYESVGYGYEYEGKTIVGEKVKVFVIEKSGGKVNE